MNQKQLLTLSLILVNEALCTTMLFPFVGLFVALLCPSLDRSSAGYLSGLLIGAFQGAQAIFCSHWGYLSDHIGRKPVFVFGLCCGSLSIIGLGLSTNLWTAVLLRSLHGIFAANAPLAKTYAAECTARSEQARAFGLLSLCWSLGAFIGPMVGGYLYDPHTSPIFSSFVVFHEESSLFVQHPALFPCVVVSMYSAAAALLVHVYLPESNSRAVPWWSWLRTTRMFLAVSQWSVVRWIGRWRRRYGALQTDAFTESDDADVLAVVHEGQTDDGAAEERREVPTTTTTQNMDDPRRDTASAASAKVLEVPVVKKEERNSLTTGLPSFAATTKGSEAPAAAAAPTEFGFRDVLRHPTLRSCVPMYMVLCACAIIYNETLPLYAIALECNGGLELSSTDVGIISSVNAGISVVCNIVFSWFTARVGTLVLWRVCMTLFGASMVMYGTTTWIKDAYHTGRWFSIAYLGLWSVTRCLSSTWAFSLSMMFVANAAPAEHLGRVTGIAHSCGSMMRSVWPLVAAPLFAWSVSSPHPFPLNHFCVFLIAAGLSGFGYRLSLPLREEDVIKKEEASSATHHQPHQNPPAKEVALGATRHQAAESELSALSHDHSVAEASEDSSSRRAVVKVDATSDAPECIPLDDDTDCTRLVHTHLGSSDARKEEEGQSEDGDGNNEMGSRQMTVEQAEAMLDDNV